MIQSALTISLVPEARGGPFVFWDDLPAGLARAAKLGFDAVEIFPRSLEDLNAKGMTVEGVESARDIQRLMRERELDLRVHGQVFRILFESAPAASLLECIMAD